MKNPIIGILGGSGNIGSKCVEIISEIYPLYATYKNNKKQDTENCTYVQMDIKDLGKVAEFCNQVDILINCAGASYKNGEKIAKIASECNIPYIDPSGESFLEDKIKEELDNNIFVLSSGYFPGLSGIMASYACSCLKNVDSISGFNVSEEIPSKSAIEDFVLTNLSGFGKALYYYKNGELVYEDGIKFVNINGDIYKLSNYITKEFLRVAEKFNVNTANWFNQIYDDKVIRKMQDIVLKSDKLEGSYSKDIDNIISFFKANVSKNNFNKLIISAKNSMENIEIEVESKESSTMSAVICSNLVKKIMEGNYKNGLYYSMDILDFKDIERDLIFKNVKVNIKKEKKEYEEGVL